MSVMHETFHSPGRIRRVLVVEDERINQELLGMILKDEYEVLFASEGGEALEILRGLREPLSLILLDLLMPGMNGMELLRRLKEDPELRRIPVIVMTSEVRAEVESLRMGANDFIQKPYQPEVVRARVFRTIELAEDRQIIQYTERDTLTGLYNKEYFYRYAEEMDLFYSEHSMDAVVVDINHFSLINERYGKNYGDEVLKRIAKRIRDLVHISGGIVCRREGDTFLIYCPHREDYGELLENISVGLAGEGVTANTRVRLRMGVYADADKSIDVERRFDRAKKAADTLRNGFAGAVAYYDGVIHEKELFEEQLLEDFHQAMEEKQFLVYFQPKYDVRGEEPVLTSAEALVRWRHPVLGMIRPDIFVPLFEKNGLIPQLDRYVWQDAAAHIRFWKDTYGLSLPVSVNVSRVDLFYAGLADTLRDIIRRFELQPEDFLLEITESAYTDDAEFIIAVVKQLREMGFRIEMDDFGTGYSSLGMLSALPIDALKIDKVFVTNAFGEAHDVRVLELILDISKYLGVPAIAEGVESRKEMYSLKEMGCDIVQGYFFSCPVTAEDFGTFIEARKAQMASE